MGHATMNRRAFLHGAARTSAGAVLVGGLPAVLAACGDDGAAAGGGGGGGLGTLDYQFSWVKNVQWAGTYIADTEGYYLDEGFEQVNLLAGGPSAPPVEGVVSSGKAFVTVSSPSTTAAAVLEGARLKIAGAQYQRSPYCIMSLADDPIETPADMAGRKVGVPQGNEPTWEAFLAVNDMDASEIEVIPVGFNPRILPDGEVEAMMAFVINEPIALEVDGIETHLMRFSDFGYAAVNNIYVVAAASLADRRDQVKAYLRGEIRGWKDHLANPEQGVRLTLEEYGADLGLDRQTQLRYADVQRELIETPDTQANGLFTLTPELVESTMGVLAVSGVEASAEELFDLSALDEIYAEDTALA